MNYKYRDFCKIFFGQKDTSLCLKYFQKSRYSSELDSILQRYKVSQVVVLEQIHADIGICVDDTNAPHNSSLLEYQGDFLITSKKNVALAVLTADCVPLVLVDDVHNVVAIVHAGWKGSFAGVLERALQTMHEKYQTRYSDIKVFFGPSARSCCYEVSLEFIKNFEQRFGVTDTFFERGNSNYFDNNLFLQKILKKYGILEQNIDIENSFCTICNLQYCSFRREKDQARRQITIVALV
jgi:polyphenol oxidase